MLRKVSRFAAFLILLAFPGRLVLAQGIFGTLDGVVTDPTGAVVPNVKIVLTDAVSGSARDTVTDGAGFYNFVSVPVGTYNLSVSAGGFEDYKASNISLGGGEHRSVNIALTVGSSSQTVSVDAQNTAVAVTDSGERSFALGTKELENFTQVGSNAAEYIKIVPGFAVQNGTSNTNGYNGGIIGINANGNGGSSQSPLNGNYSYNGLPNNSLDIVADGAHVSDPGCNCDTPVNPNSDFLQEFKVLTSNFAAEDQKGPILITSVTKSGGTSYHGSGFISARNYALNANDWLNNYSNVKQPQNKFYYPGGTIGGPIFIPGTRFHKDNTKLFFWTGFEYFYQVLDTGLLRATVPPASELAGDFSPASVGQEGALTAANKKPGELTAAAIAKFGGTTIPACNGPANGACIDPNMLALANLFPKVNQNPNSTGGYNYTQAEIFNQNNRQWAIRGDWNISEATKVFVRYNYQRELQQFPVGLWWTNTDQVPYPTPIEGKNKSDSLSGSITHVFSPNMTNETVFAYTYVGFPNVFANPSKVNRDNVGYNYKGLFNNGVTQIPSFGNFGPSEAALVFNPGGFEAGGASAGLFADKWMPSMSDTLTRIHGDHTFKVGFFYEWIRNSQPANNYTNGEALVSVGNTFSYGNEYADLLTGNLNSYEETTFNRLNTIDYNTIEFFGQDTWKATRRLTLNFGVRFTHFQPWIDALGYGYSIFNPAAFSPSCAASPTYCGFEWHAKDSSVPVGGFPTRTLFYQPRLGAAYDIHGNGFTVARGGWGRFYYHSGQFTNGLDASAGVKTANLSPSNWVGGPGCPTNPSTGSNLIVGQFSCYNVSATPASPSAVDSKDDNQPYTDSWSANIDQQTPWQGLLEIGYVGNRSRDLQNTEGGYGSNINVVPYGAMFGATNPATANANLYRPYLNYGDLVIATNNLYSNYNAMQVSWVRHSGRYVFQTNYTWQKGMGIANPAANPFSLSANYGVLPSDRRNLFNAAYSIDLGTLVHSNHLVNGVANGWQLSGVTQLQSGANLTYGGTNTPNNGPNLNYNVSYTCVETDAEQASTDPKNHCLQSAAIIPGSNTVTNPMGIAINNQSIYGTNIDSSAASPNPIYTCGNHKQGSLGAHTYVNSNCFEAPTVPGQGNLAMLPVAYGPAYFDSDLSVFKNFQIRESMKLQIRAQAYNFLNHPLYSFPNSGNLSLQFEQDPASQVITQQNSTFGQATTKQGARIVEFGAKFFF
jgi:hypothetical protein